MREGELTYDDFLQRLNIQDVLIDAGYHLNRRDGLRYPSYVRIDSDGRRIRGDKFIVTQQGKCCFQAQQQRVYNIISFIKEHPHFFSEYRVGMSLDRLVNLVCNRLLNHPIEDRTTRIIQPKRDIPPFDITNYDLHKFNLQDRATQKKFYPYFKNRGIDLYTQYAFHRDFYLATKHREDGAAYTNLSFPLTLPKGDGTIVGFEERGRAKMDGSGSYKGKAEGSNSSEGLWIASPARTSLPEAKHIYWFESAYDAMAYYQLHQRENKDLRKAVFVSTGGAAGQQQFKSVIEAVPHAIHHLCFDRDRAGQMYAINFALTHAGKVFTSKLSKNNMLVIRLINENLQCEMNLEPFDFQLITATLGINSVKEPINKKEVVHDDLDIGDGYLQEMKMTCMDEYEAACAEGASGEELERMRENLSAIEDVIRGYSVSGSTLQKCILYEPAADGYKDWNEQLLAKIKLQESAHEEPAREEEPEQERQARFHR